MSDYQERELAILFQHFTIRAESHEDLLRNKDSINKAAENLIDMLSIIHSDNIDNAQIGIIRLPNRHFAIIETYKNTPNSPHLLIYDLNTNSFLPLTEKELYKFNGAAGEILKQKCININKGLCLEVQNREVVNKLKASIDERNKALRATSYYLR